jgi:hypothetical protein
MKSLHTCSFLAALLFSLGISAQTIHITGHYLDQQDAPIANALVEYYLFGEVFADSARTDSDGAFALQLTFTGIEETPPAGFLTDPAPNPFTGLCSFSIHSHSPATILVTDINGLHVDKRVLPQAGIYRCAWGGKNRIGQPQPAGTYVITVVGEGFVATRKVVFQGPATQRVTAEHVGEGSAALKQLLTDDRITFTRYNTSDLDIFLETPSSNTYLGIVTGNIGPQVTAPLTAEVHINDLEPWNLNLHFHNDDQSVYTVSDTDNFAIVSDSLLIFTGSQQALYQPVITATDPADPTLTAQLTAHITIITEFQVEITGTYLDQQSNPIAEAEVTYLENGANPLSQTTTATNGQWSLAVLLNPNQMQDQLTFVKQHTTPLALTFDPPLADTTFGIVTGNIGPQVTAPLTAEVHINDLEPWNLNLHFHNDDQSVYTVSDTDNFAIVSDSLLIFTGSQQALYQPVITATDPADPTLTAQLTANITIITEFQVEITGTYLDQQNNPIAEAEVTYLENGTTPLSQTTTATNGQWSLAVLLNPNQVQDQLTFAKPHTTPLALTFDPPLADTTFGILTGNIGPQALMPLDATVHVDDLAPWNLNLYFHNDDQSVYTVGNPNFAIGQDSLLVFTGTEAGNYQFTITATDPQDATLTANTSANINISDQRIFTVSGSYADQQGEPIAGAMVDYWLGGDELLAQSFTQPDGAFTMQVTTGWAPGRSNDVLSFSKTNTSYLELAFATPQADTTFGVVTGNIGPTVFGSIAETRFTIEGSLQWNLNDYFHNDDQSIYTLTGSDFSIANQHWLQLPQPAPGDYNTTITATDPQDGSLTAQTTAGVQVQYTIELPESFSIPEDSPQSILFDAADYLNPNCNLALAFSIVSQTNPQLIHLATEGSAVMISSLQPDGFGQSIAALRIENTQNGHADTLWFDVNVMPMTDIFGTIADIFDSTLVIPNATIYLFAVAPGAVTPVITDTIAVVNTNSNGYFALQLPENPDALTHYFVRISVDSEDYYPYHTWITVEPGGSDLQTDFTLIPLEAENFSMDLYNLAFRDTLCNAGINGGSTCRWREPPNIYVTNNNTNCPGVNLTPNVNTMVYNLNNILPNFAQHEMNTSLITVKYDYSTPLQDNEMGISWDNNIGGAGVVIMIRDGPRISKCVTKYKWYIEPNNPDNVVYNQELGTCFGAIHEPPQSPNYSSVFTDPSSANTYTPYDFNAQHIRLSRSMIHYRNFSYIPGDSEGLDWDAHPSIVDQWYNQPSSKENTFLDYKVLDFDGSVIEKGSYKYSEIPSRIMELSPALFTAEEIAQRRLSEQQGAATVQLTTGHRPPPNAPHTTRLRHNPSQHYNTFE